MKPRLWLEFETRGKPETRGSKVAKMVFVKGGKGQRRPIVVDDNEDSGPWMKLLGQRCYDHAVAAGVLPRGVLGVSVRPWEGPVLLNCTIYVPRPDGHYRTNGELKASAPVFPISASDVDKFHRPLQDALKGVAFVDDRQVCKIVTDKQFSGNPGVRIAIYHLPRTIEEARTW